MSNYDYKSVVADTLVIKEKLKELMKYVSNLDKDWNGNPKNITAINSWIRKNPEIVEKKLYNQIITDLQQFLKKDYNEIDLHILRLRIMQEIERRFYFVYKHTCPNGKVYIGVTCSEEAEYRWISGWGYRKNVKFYADIQKYGLDNIQHEILYANLPPQEAAAKEQELIAFYNSNNVEFGYNIDKGGKLPPALMTFEGLFRLDWVYQDRARRRPYKLLIKEDRFTDFLPDITKKAPDIVIQSKELLRYNGTMYYFTILANPSYKEKCIEDIIKVFNEIFIFGELKVKYEKRGFNGCPMTYEVHNNIIIINLSIVNDNKYKIDNIVFDVAHEFRHIYQAYVVKRKLRPAYFENYENWGKVLTGQIPYKTDVPEEEYLKQDIEFDAFAFAEVFQALYGSYGEKKSYVDKYFSISKMWGEKYIEYMEKIRKEFFDGKISN